MKRLNVKALKLNALKVAGLLLALGAADTALADRWDSLGSKHSPQVQRYGYVDQHPGRGHARGHDKQRSSINIIVAPRAPISAWAPRWDERREHQHYSRNVVSLYRDRQGACYERETDRYGRVVKRRVANYNCNF